MVTEKDIHVLVAGDVDVYKPNGDPLIMLRRRSISEEVLDAAHPNLRYVAQRYRSDNRGKYAGAARSSVVYKDGTVSKSSRTRTPDGKPLNIESAAIGYFDRQGGRIPFCRATAFTANEVEKWKHIVPLTRSVAEVFRGALTKRYEVQMVVARATPSEYVIKGTPFTTLTVNRNIAGRIHKDAGDFKGGFGCLSVFRSGTYKGGVLVFPEYGVGADMGHGDVILFNPHDWHGVTDFYDTEKDFERISVVYYYRERMQNCLPAAQELARVRDRGKL